MCRIVAQVSISPSSPTALLVEDPYCLLKQSNAQPNRLQEDGWGISWYENGESQSLHSAHPLFQEEERLTQLNRKIRSQIVIAHIRAASNPLALPLERIIRLENTQPFVHPPWIFAHNGTIYPAAKLKAELGGGLAPLKGNNDSELLFALLLRHWNRSFGSMPRAIKGILGDLRRLDPDSFSALNFAASDGKRLYAYCFWNPKRLEEGKRSLGLGTQPFFQMSYFVTPERIVVASEPTSQENHWQWLQRGALLVAWRDQKKLQYEISFP
jgi:glutamine amidotransferase